MENHTSLYDFNPSYIEPQSSAFSDPKMHPVDIDTLTSIASFGFGSENSYITTLNYSCNTLLFFDKKAYYYWCTVGLLNPIPNGFGLDQEDTHLYGFGFSPKTKRYKLFKVPGREPTRTMEVLMFGTGTNHEWRSVFLPFPIHFNSLGAYFDGVIYWVGEKKENAVIIYALDVETEKIKLSTVLEVGSVLEAWKLQPFNDTIYAIIFMRSPNSKIQVWRMRDKDLWIRDFVICDVNLKMGLFHLVEAFDDGGISFLLNHDFFYLDKSGKKIKQLTLPEKLQMLVI